MMPISVHTGKDGVRAEVVNMEGGHYSVLFFKHDTWTHETITMSLTEAINMAQRYTSMLHGPTFLTE